MSRHRKPATLYLRKARGDRTATSTILSGSREISTGCGEHELERAQAKLAEFITMRLRWLPSTNNGWIDLEKGMIYRRGSGEDDDSKKRQPPCLIRRKLLPHLIRWRKRDLAANIDHIVHYNGRPIKDPYHGWESVRVAAGATAKDRPHVLRHSCVTLFVMAGLTRAEIASFTGMTTAVLERCCLHGSLEDQPNIAATAPKIAPRNGEKRARSK